MTQILTRAEEVLTEWRRRQRERALNEYRPSTKQLIFHNSPAHIRLFVGANGTGKTTCGVGEGVSYAIGYRPWDGSKTRTPPTSVLIVCRDFTHDAEEDVIPIINKWLPKSRIFRVDRLANGKPHKWTLDNGSTIKLMSYEQDPMAFEGIAWDFAHFNEPPPRSIWIPVNRGLAKKGGHAILTFTPIGLESAWIHDELYSVAGQDESVFAVTATLDDSFMDEEAKKQFIAVLDEDEKEARVHGRFKHLAGRVYKEFNRDAHVVPPDRIEDMLKLISDPSIPKGMVVDPHDRKPFAMAWFMVVPTGDIVFIAEWPQDSFHGWKSCDLGVNDYVATIMEIESERKISPVIWRIMDPNYGPRKSVITSGSISDAFAELGIFFITDVNDAIAEGHIAVKDKLRYDKEKPISATNKPRLFVMPDLWNMLYSFEHYSWESRSNEAEKGLVERVRQRDKDHMDLVRYVCMLDPAYFSPKAMAEQAKERNKSAARFRGVL